MVKDEINKLPKTDLAQLKIALENDFSQEIALDDGTFIGVNVYCMVGIEVIDKINSWVHGRRNAS